MSDKIKTGYNRLFNALGPQHWWPGDSPWEICTGAVLTQNTNWQNVEKAIINLKNAKALDPETILSLPETKLAQMILPSGFFRLKTKRLKNVAAWWQKHVKANQLAGFDTPAATRDSLLNVNGVGPETADSILLYCFNLPLFVIDAYTRRIAARHFQTEENSSYDELQRIFMSALPANPAIYNEYHGLLVQNAKIHCLKNRCLPSCPLR